MAPQMEYLRNSATAVIVVSHLLGGDHPMAPSAMTASTVAAMQLIALLHTFMGARPVKKVEDVGGTGSQTTWGFAVGLIGTAARSTAAQIAVGSVAVLALARALRLLQLLASPPGVCLCAFVLGGLVHAAVKAAGAAPPAHEADCHERCSHCGGQDCGADGSACPYQEEFWADLPSPAAEEEDAAHAGTGTDGLVDVLLRMGDFGPGSSS